MDGMFESPPGGGATSGSGDRGADDPVSWLQIEQGWNVVASDGAAVGTVAQIEGDKGSDIFDGLAVETGSSSGVRYVPAEAVGQIFPGRITLKTAAADLGTLAPFQAAPPETTWRPGGSGLSARLARRLRGRR